MHDFVKLRSANFRTLHRGCLVLYISCFPQPLLKWQLLEKGSSQQLKLFLRLAINTYLVLAHKNYII